MRPDEFWDGPAEKLGEEFRLTKGQGDEMWTATCERWSHARGWEIRLLIDGRGLVLSSVSRDAGEMQDRAAEWKAMLMEQGWGRAGPTRAPG